MSEESVSYGKEPKYMFGQWVSFNHKGNDLTGVVTAWFNGVYTIQVGFEEFSVMEDAIKGLSKDWGISYVADKPKASLEGQVGGEHYKNLAIQPVEYCYRNNIPAIESSIIRYATRHRDKNKAQDIEKIIHYAKILLQLEYNYTDEQINEL